MTMPDNAPVWRDRFRSILVVYVPLIASIVAFGAEFVWRWTSPDRLLDYPMETVFTTTATMSAASAAAAALLVKRCSPFERFQKLFFGAFAGFGVYFLGCCVLALIRFVGGEFF